MCVCVHVRAHTCVCLCVCVCNVYIDNIRLKSSFILTGQQISFTRPYFFFLPAVSSNIVRKAEELPFHYIATNNIEGLRRCLLTREMFEHLYTERSKQMLMQYWQVAGGYQLAAESYKKALQDFLTVSR